MPYQGLWNDYEPASRRLYFLSNSDYEEYSPLLLSGPDVGDWELFCKALLPIAVRKAIQHEWDTTRQSWVGCMQIKEALAALLFDLGFRIERVSEFNLCGPGIITEERDWHRDKELPLDGTSLNMLYAHNEQVDKRD